MKKATFLVVVSSVILSFGCKKSNSNGGGCTLSASSIVGAYVRTSDTYQATATSAIIDYFAQEPACSKDDILTLKADGTYTWTDGLLACGTAPNGTWSLPGGNGINVDRNYGIVTKFDCNSWTLSTPVGVYPIEITTYVKK